MGRGGGGTSTQVVSSDAQHADLPLESNLTGPGIRMLEWASPYSNYGAGYQLLPRSPLGQVYMPGPNPTLFGQPFNGGLHGNFFGNPSQVPLNPFAGMGGGGTPPQQGGGGASPWMTLLSMLGGLS